MDVNPGNAVRAGFEQGGLLGEATLNLAERRRGRGQREYRSTRGCDDTWSCKWGLLGVLVS
jgi:hypothetical protein